MSESFTNSDSSYNSEGGQVKAKEKILNALGREIIAWIGGKTSFELSEELGLHINTVRLNLKILQEEGKIYACYPRVYRRLDGHTGNTALWYRGNPFE